MHPEITAGEAGDCPKCGMTLEPATPSAATRIEWVCPMHPQIVRSEPGACPICGMALEPRQVTIEEIENPELRDMSRRFWVSVALSVPIFALAMSEHFPGVYNPLPPAAIRWTELALSSPVVLWGAWSFFVRGWRSVVTRNLNMFTLIGLGIAVAYVYSLVATVAPSELIAGPETPHIPA